MPKKKSRKDWVDPEMGLQAEFKKAFNKYPFKDNIKKKRAFGKMTFGNK